MISGDAEARQQLQNPVPRRELLAWAFYDVANSGYTTVVLTTIYSAYFVAVVAGELESQSPGLPTLLWTVSVALANLIVLCWQPPCWASSRRDRSPPQCC
jgi:UMF1 family MFS transporter